MTIFRPSRLALCLLAAGALAACDSVSDGGAAADPAIDVSGDPALLSGAADSNADRAADIDTAVMIGDSITKGALPFLDERFSLLGLDHTIEAENGKRMTVSSAGNPSGADIAAFFAANGDGDHRDEVWVVALGTNDTGQYADAAEIATVVDGVLAQVPAEVALVWVDTWVENRSEHSELINSVIRQRVEQRGDSVVAAWTGFVDDVGVMSGDAVHPTTDGADVFAFVVTETVRAFLDR